MRRRVGSSAPRSRRFAQRRGEERARARAGKWRGRRLTHVAWFKGSEKSPKKTVKNAHVATAQTVGQPGRDSIFSMGTCRYILTTILR